MSLGTSLRYWSAHAAMHLSIPACVMVQVHTQKITQKGMHSKRYTLKKDPLCASL